MLMQMGADRPFPNGILASVHRDQGKSSLISDQMYSGYVAGV